VQHQAIRGANSSLSDSNSLNIQAVLSTGHLFVRPVLAGPNTERESNSPLNTNIYGQSLDLESSPGSVQLLDSTVSDTGIQVLTVSLRPVAQIPPFSKKI